MKTGGVGRYLWRCDSAGDIMPAHYFDHCLPFCDDAVQELRVSPIMGFNTLYRFSVHAVIVDEHGRVLLLRQTYGDKRWGLPGGGVGPGETVHDAILRECREELSVNVETEAFSGLYYHSEFNAQVGIFRCCLPEQARISLGPEHSEYAWFPIAELGQVQRLRVENAIQYGARSPATPFEHENLIAARCLL